jgi:hypothetical protein
MRHLLFAILAATASASAQTVETDPLQCWWRTSDAAVRVGQPFSVVLTCAVVETDTVTVVPNQGPLDPIVTQMPPFEVLGGTHQSDLRTQDHRFFQYEYRLRIVAEDAFGKDVKLPDTKISYHLQSRTGKDPAIEGRELTYDLPPMSVRVLSLVPGDETDIRDASSSTFGDVESRRFRANVLRTVAGVLFALAGLGLVVAAARLFGRYRAESATDAQMVPDVAILRQIGRELSAVGRERGVEGWTPALVGRLMTGLRIAAAFALSRRVIQVPFTSARGLDGHLVVETGWIHRRRVVVAGSVTPELIRQATQRSEVLQELEHALDHVTVTQYGRESRVDDHDLDDALQVGERAVRRLAADHTWWRRKLAAIGHIGAPLGPRVWSRWNG